MITRQYAFQILKKYNKDHFHLQHALTVEAVMKWYAKELGYEDNAEYWGIVGLLHDIDFELYPDEHCQFISGKEHFFHLVFWLYIYCHTVAYCYPISM